MAYLYILLIFVIFYLSLNKKYLILLNTLAYSITDLSKFVR